ncbi:MAG: hypothetical protein MZV70_29425 [Desulfobacterales bacterium]|nr:hypothetical protein [Desulfobacterales bacterium]
MSGGSPWTNCAWGTDPTRIPRTGKEGVWGLAAGHPGRPGRRAAALYYFVFMKKPARPRRAGARRRRQSRRPVGGDRPGGPGPRGPGLPRGRPRSERCGRPRIRRGPVRGPRVRQVAPDARTSSASSSSRSTTWPTA